ncbi:MAG: phage tail protein [Veillonella sp.]|nr:phage tail protein [Veillonella sp.]
MEQFPNIRYPIYPIDENTPDVTRKGQVENMTLLTHRKTTKTLRSYTVQYKIPNNEYKRLRDFYDKVNTADIFEWTHPATGELIRVRFADQLHFSSSDFGIWTGSVQLQEV